MLQNVMLNLHDEFGHITIRNYDGVLAVIPQSEYCNLPLILNNPLESRKGLSFLREEFFGRGFPCDKTLLSFS